MRLASDARRAQILGCAERLFRERHYGEVSIEAIAEAAGVTRPLIHHYFGSKRDLYVEVVRQMFRGGAPPVPEYVEGVTPEERLAESVDRWLEMVAKNRETWLAALGAEGLGRDPEVERILDQVREAAVDNIVAVLGLGKASPMLRGKLRAFGGFAEAATREWLERKRFTGAQMHELLTTTLLRLVETERAQPVPKTRSPASPKPGRM